METGANLQIHRYVHNKCSQGGDGGGGGGGVIFKRLKETQRRLLDGISVTKTVQYFHSLDALEKSV